MKTELQNSLIEKHKWMFTINDDINEGEPFHPIAFGFECGDGWYFILENLLSCIDGYYTHNDKDQKQHFQITQIKEKFGGLRFYYSGGNSHISGMVWLAEHLSYATCETCGSTENVSQTKGWIKTICGKCLEK